MSAVEPGGAPVTVLLCDERTLRRQCLAGLLELRGIRVRIPALENGGKTDGAAPAGEPADLAVIDIGEKACSHPGVKKILDDLQSTMPNVPIVVISDRDDGSAVADAMQLGARAYFPSSLDSKILVETLRFVQNGGTFVPLSALMGGHDRQRLPPANGASAIETLGITGRELGVLELLQRGRSNKVIARELDIEEGTVKVHVHRILKKLHADNRTQAALLARQIAEEVVKPDFPAS